MINLLTGKRAEVLPTFATHEGVARRGRGGVSDAERKTLGLGAAQTSNG